MGTAHGSDAYGPDSYAQVVQRLAAEFGDQHSFDAVTAAVLRANTELRQMAETNTTYTLLDRARQRLHRLPPTRDY